MARGHRNHRGRGIAIVLTPGPKVRTRLDSSPCSWPITRIDHDPPRMASISSKSNPRLYFSGGRHCRDDRSRRAADFKITRVSRHPRQLFTAALGILWSNVLIFASWYWRLDSGGPNAQDRRKSHDSGACLFPQMQMRNQNWKPGFVDYFLGVQYKYRVFTN